MKIKILITLLLVLVLTGYFTFTQIFRKDIEVNTSDRKPALEATETQTITVEESGSVIENEEPGNDNYKVNWLVIRNNSNLSLYSNSSERLTSEEVKLKYNCSHIISAGFINESNDHIGLFKNHKGIVSNSVKNNTFNGYFSLDDQNIANISNQVPENSKIAVQSGPLLFLDNRPLTLSLKNDKYSRRIVAAVNRQNEAIFIVFYSKNSPFNGPLLSELPSLIEDLENNTSINITDAINLDGGTHSVFKSGQLNLTEASIAGGYFCINF
jgi:hypothetical protein